MRTQLWVCPANCGRTLTSEKIVLPVRCGCGKVDKSDHTVTEIEVEPTITKGTGCLNRGKQIRLEECKGCTGRVQIKVFECFLHGECTIKKRIEGIHLCDGIVQRPVDSGALGILSGRPGEWRSASGPGKEG